MEFAYSASDKGRAVLAAIDAGLIPMIDDEHYDIVAFNRFWELYTQSIAEKERKAEDRLLWAEFLFRCIVSAILGALVGIDISLITKFAGGRGFVASSLLAIFGYMAGRHVEKPFLLD